jgi:hypothetical protein
MQANVVTRGRLACEGSACPLPCGGHELDIALLFRLSPKAALNPVIVEDHKKSLNSVCRVNGRILLVILLQRCSRSTFSWGSFLSFFAFKDGILDTQISALGG